MGVRLNASRVCVVRWLCAPFPYCQLLLLVGSTVDSTSTTTLGVAALALLLDVEQFVAQTTLLRALPYPVRGTKLATRLLLRSIPKWHADVALATTRHSMCLGSYTRLQCLQLPVVPWLEDADAGTAHPSRAVTCGRRLETVAVVEGWMDAVQSGTDVVDTVVLGTGTRPPIGDDVDGWPCCMPFSR